MLHCGYSVEINPVMEILKQYIGELQLKNDYYTAVHYNDGFKMTSWFAKAKATTGYITGIYCSKKDAVCKIMIGNLSLYLIVAHNSNIKPLEMKKCIALGLLGELLPLPRLAVECVPKSFD